MTKKRKPRILWVGEASFLNSGYAVYGQEVLGRLHNTGKYDFGELGIYGHWSDNRRFDIPWTYYGNLPDTHDADPEYFGDNLNQFGQWKFEEVCLDFQPDIVWDIRDWWMGEYVERSPFRNFYHWTIMPTVDSIPQQEQWLSSYCNADSVFAYTEFSRDYLESSTNHKINVLGLAPPAADYNVFKPVPDKAKHRKNHGFMDDILIVGTIMRNQRRKLYPDLISSFRKFLEQNPRIANKTYLYLHTSYPDNGWDIPMLIRESGMGHKVLFTYICMRCRHIRPSFFAGACQVCHKCGGHTSHLPSVHVGVTPKEMATILNWFDLYVQYSICEGFGIPQVEAAGCGVPFMAVNYSAMESVLKNLDGIPIRVQRLFREPESGSFRALPDNDHFIKLLGRFLNSPQSIRFKAGRDVFRKVKETYNWDKTAKMWEEHFDSIPLKDRKETWNSPPRIKPLDNRLPTNVSNEEFVKWIISKVWGEPSKLNSYMALRMIRDLNNQQRVVSTGGFFFNEDSMQTRNRHTPFNRENAAQEMVKMANFRHHWERRRTGILQEDPPLFIKHKKEAVS